MKSNFTNTIGTIVFVLCSLFLQAQTTSSDSSIVNPNPTSSMYKVKVGDTVQINYLFPVATTISWNTLDSKIAEVLTDGKVIGKSSGNTSIYIIKADGSVMMKWEVQVEAKISNPIIVDTGIVISPKPPINSNEYTIKIGESINIQPAVMIALPYKWISLNNAIATVDQNGTVTGLSKGMDSIYISLANGTILSQYVFNITDGTKDSLPLLIFNPNEYAVNIGETINITPDATFSTAIKWKTLDPKIATIDIDGNVTGLTIGSTVIYMCLPNDSIISKYLITILDTVSVITPTNFIYQNYTSVEQIDSTVLRIIFNKEITDISEIAKYLELNIQYQAIVSNQLKTGNTLTITSVSIDPTNNKAIIITTKEVIPATANVSLTFNNVALLSTNGESFNQLAQTATFVKIAKAVSMSVYPNIASSTITISAENNSTIEIFSINGILLNRLTSNSAIQTIDVSAYRPGTYIVKLKTSKAQTISRPFIKL